MHLSATASVQTKSNGSALAVSTATSLSSAIPDISQQFSSKPSIQLDVHDTVIHHIVSKFKRKNPLPSDPTLIFKCKHRVIQLLNLLFNHESKHLILLILVSAAVLTVILDNWLNGSIIHSLELAFLKSILMIIGGLYYIFNCNYFIFINGMSTFVVWYKLLNIIIATIGVTVLADFWMIENYYQSSKLEIENSKNVYYARFVIQVIASFTFLTCISLIDGYNFDHSRFLKFAKISSLLGGVFTYVYAWFNIYLNINGNFDSNKQFTINFFGITNESYYWRSITLSSYFKVVVFLFIQISKDIKIPHKINVFPFLAKIKRINYNQMETSSTNHSNNSKVNSNILSMSPSLTPQNMDENLDAETDVNSFEEDDIIDGTIDKHNSFVDNLEIRVVCEKTVFFKIFKNLFKFSDSKSVYWSQVLLGTRLQGFIISIGSLCFAIRVLAGSAIAAWVAIMFQAIIVGTITFVILNINCNYLTFKMTSLAVLWKIYNGVTFSICVDLAERANKIGDFDNDTRTGIESLLLMILNTMTYIVLLLVTSLSQGLFVFDKAKVGVLFLLVIFFMFRGLFYYFDEQLDWNFKFANRNVSIRAQIVNRAFDLALWLFVQFYQTVRHPEKFPVISKIDIEWKHDNITNK